MSEFKPRKCTDCKVAIGGQHLPGCHRQGLVTMASDYTWDLLRMDAQNAAERSVEAERCPGCGQTKCPQCDGSVELKEALKANDEWAKQDVETARQMLAVMAERDQMRNERDSARGDAAIRLKQMLTQSDLDQRAIKEWEQALIKATNLLRPFASVKFVPGADDPIINGAVQADYDAARVFLDGFDSRRKAGRGGEGRGMGVAWNDDPDGASGFMEGIELEDIRCEPTEAALKARSHEAGLPEWLWPAGLVRVLTEIMERRKTQDSQHGGPSHDDTHRLTDWVGYMQNELSWVQPDNCEDRLLEIAALAVAAIQSSRRKRDA